MKINYYIPKYTHHPLAEHDMNLIKPCHREHRMLQSRKTLPGSSSISLILFVKKAIVIISAINQFNGKRNQFPLPFL